MESITVIIFLVEDSQIGTAKSQVQGTSFCKDKLLGTFKDPTDRGCWYTCTFFTGARSCCLSATPCYFEPIPLIPLGFCGVSSLWLIVQKMWCSARARQTHAHGNVHLHSSGFPRWKICRWMYSEVCALNSPAMDSADAIFELQRASAGGLPRLTCN